MQIRLPEWPIRSQVREFGSPPHPNRACEHVCSVLGPLSRKVTVGGRPLVPFSRRICLSLFFFLILSTPTSRVVSSPHPLPNSLPRRGGWEPGAGPEEGAEFGTSPAAGTVAPAPGSSARVPATSLSSDTAALLPARGRPPPVLRQRCPPCACRLSADRGGAVLRGSGNSCDIQNTENKTPHLIRRGAGALRGRGAACPRSSPTPPPAVLRQPLGVTEHPPPHPPADKGPGQTRRPASLRSGRRRRRRRRRRWIAQKEARARPGSAVWGRAARCA